MAAMTTYVALLRGVNVGGNNKVPMAELRLALQSAGFDNVRTYIQSGNALVDAARTKTQAIANRIHEVISSQFGLDIATVAVDAATLARVVERCPYPVDNPRLVHVVFLPGPLDAKAEDRLDQLQQAVTAKGARDSVTADGAVMYLHTPDGFGTSDLAKALSTRGPGAHRAGTARNWATVTKLFELARG